MTKRRFLLPLFVCLCISSVAVAGLPLAFLVEPAAKFVGGLVVRSVGRQAIVTIGVAANDASWIARTSGLISRAAAILMISGAVVDYEIPTIPDVPVPSPVKPAPSGAIGSATNPFPYNDSSLRINVNKNYKYLDASLATDGVHHYIPAGDYTLNEFMSTVVNILSYSTHKPGQQLAVFLDPYECYSSYGHSSPYPIPVPGGYLYSQGFALCSPAPEKSPFFNFSGSANSSSISVKYIEQPDSVKRFKRTADGFIPDTTDPDWSEAEKVAFNQPATLQFKDAQSVVNVSASSAATNIQSATQNGYDVNYRSLTLNANAQPSNVSEQLLKNASASDVIAAANPANNSNTNANGQAIQFPSDYARAGEAVSAAKSITDKLLQSASASTDPAVPTNNNFKSAFFDGTFDNLLSWTVPGHSSVCPVGNISFFVFGTAINLSMDSQCAILEDPIVSNVAAVSFTVLWLLCALFVVLRA